MGYVKMLTDTELNRMLELEQLERELCFFIGFTDEILTDKQRKRIKEACPLINKFMERL